MTLFIADEHIPAQSILKLRSVGLDVLSIRESYQRLPDADIIPLAESMRRVVITCDSDFGELIFRKRLQCSSGVIYLRLGAFRPEEPAEFILMYMDRKADIFDHRFSVISRQRLRQRTV